MLGSSFANSQHECIKLRSDFRTTAVAMKQNFCFEHLLAKTYGQFDLNAHFRAEIDDIFRMDPFVQGRISIYCKTALRKEWTIANFKV